MKNINTSYPLELEYVLKNIIKVEDVVKQAEAIRESHSNIKITIRVADND